MTDLSAAASDAVVTTVAEVAAAVLPADGELIVGPAQPGSPHVTAAFAAAALAELTIPGRVIVLAGTELLETIARGPAAAAPLHETLRAALDAAARQLGASVVTARTVALDDVAAEAAAGFTTVPLIGTGIAAAVLVTADAVAGAGEPLPPSAAPATPAGSAAAGPQSVEVPAARSSIEATIEPDISVGGPVHPSPLGTAASRGIEMLHGVDMEVTVELGRTRMTVRDLLALSPGAVLELDRAAGSPADLLVNGRLIARGEVVVVDEDFGLRVTEILDDTAVV
jgi:flagellar motor switch protein FliN/FliY